MGNNPTMQSMLAVDKVGHIKWMFWSLSQCLINISTELIIMLPAAIQRINVNWQGRGQTQTVW